MWKRTTRLSLRRIVTCRVAGQIVILVLPCSYHSIRSPTKQPAKTCPDRPGWVASMTSRSLQICILVQGSPAQAPSEHQPFKVSLVLMFHRMDRVLPDGPLPDVLAVKVSALGDRPGELTEGVT